MLEHPNRSGTAKKCSLKFLEEHTLPRWAEAINASLRAAQTLSDIDPLKTLVIGHSEGGIIATRVAAENSNVSHIGLLSTNGPTQLFDLVQTARDSGGVDESWQQKEERVREVYSLCARVLADPDSIARFAWGHPYRRWSSFLETSTLDKLLRSRARVYLIHGSDDKVVPVATFEVLRSELVRHHRDLTAELIEGAGHSLRITGQSVVNAMMAIFNRRLDWFQEAHTLK